MDFYTLSDKAILEELGSRLKELRLKSNITQDKLAELTSLSLNTIKNTEKGRCKLSSLIAILRALNALDDLNSFVAAVSISPIQLVKMKGKERRRASGSRGHEENKESVEW